METSLALAEMCGFLEKRGGEGEGTIMLKVHNTRAELVCLMLIEPIFCRCCSYHHYYIITTSLRLPSQYLLALMHFTPEEQISPSSLVLKCKGAKFCINEFPRR